MRIESIRRRLREHGAQACHEHRVLRLWAMALPQHSGKRKPEFDEAARLPLEDIALDESSENIP